jgi:glucose-6-phosphate isomerase
MSIQGSPAWKALEQHAAHIAQTHLRTLLADDARCRAMTAEHESIVLDYARQNATLETMSLLGALAEAAGLRAKIDCMFGGEPINATEKRSVLHVALRMPRNAGLEVGGRDVVADVHAVLDSIQAFSDRVRSGEWRGATDQPLTDVVAIGIGGSYLGPEFVAEALRTEPACARSAGGRRLRFLANVDPIDAYRSLDGLDPARTLAVVISKTFTTAETMLNARTVRRWFVDMLGESAVARHMVAVSTNLGEVEAFGIDPRNAFGFWDWVGGRYSVWSAVGAVPLALHYGFEPFSQFLAGGHDIDRHFQSAEFAGNIPVILGLLGVWNATFLGRSTRALLPYCQALLKLAPHIQQVDMESNGKRVDLAGAPLGFDAGPIDFGEPGTNGQHSFYQLIHQGRVIPADFVGFRRSQQPLALPGEEVSNHDELMANFFAQPDALAVGKTADEVRAEGTPEWLVPHKVFPGNRPSSVLLLDELTPFTTGQLLAIFEHRTAVEGFIWNINSFDQWGVELGKQLAKQVRGQLHRSRTEGAPVEGFNPSTARMLERYLAS